MKRVSMQLLVELAIDLMQPEGGDPAIAAAIAFEMDKWPGVLRLKRNNPTRMLRQALSEKFRLPF